MGDSFLIIAPLLVLAVVFFLGFAGCSFSAPTNPDPDPTPDPDPGPSETLTFKARVPTAFTVIGEGVRFAWTRPDATTEETAVVTVSIPDGADNVYQHQIPSPAPGSWSGRCQMAVAADGATGDDISENKMFTLDFSVMPHNVLLFQAGGTIGAFEIVVIGLEAA